MGRNTIDKKRVHVQDDLYEEILNGFNQSFDKDDKTTVTLSIVQKQRTAIVAESFLSNPKTRAFTADWIGRLSGAHYLEDVLGVVWQVSEEDDEEEIEENEESKKGFSLLGAVKLFNLLHTMNTLYRSYKAFTQAKKSFDDFKVKFDESSFSKSAKDIVLLGELERILKGMLLPVLTIGGELMVTHIINNKKVNEFFDNAEELIGGSLEGILLQLAINVAIQKVSALAGPQGALIVGGINLATWIPRLAIAGYNIYKNRELISNAIKAYSLWTDFDDKAAYDFQKFITEEITKPYLVPQVEKVGQIIDNLVEGLEKKLDVSNVVSSKIQEVKDDFDVGYETVRRFGTRGEETGKTISYSVKKTSIGVQLNASFDNIIGGVFDSILKSHAIRYNVALSEESYQKMKNGLYALQWLSEAQKGALRGFSEFYTTFDNFSESVKKSLMEKIEYVSLPKTEKENHQEPTEQVNPPSSQSTGEVSSTQPPGSKRKKLRLSEKTLQPIHPIFTNGALSGIELELLDAQDKKISVKVSNWLNPKPSETTVKMEWTGNNKTLVRDYINFHTDLDIVKNEYGNILEQEKQIDETVTRILNGEKIETK